MDEINKWFLVQDKTLTQKSKAHWIFESDRNNKYFFNYVKVRESTNNISVLRDGNGRLLHKKVDIEEKILGSYR